MGFNRLETTMDGGLKPHVPHAGLRPMLLTDTADFPPQLDEWAVEVKWEGMRVLVHTDSSGHVAALVSRKGWDFGAQFPELLPAGGGLPPDSVLDGEVIVNNQSMTDLLRRLRMRRTAKILASVNDCPADLMVFDVLRWRGDNTTGLTYDQRRELLELCDGEISSASIRYHVPAAFPGIDADTAFAFTKVRGMEGVVFKHRQSLYLPGERTGHWRRLKHDRPEVGDVTP